MFKKGLTLLALLLLLVPASAQRPRRQLQRGTYTLDQIRWRDNCVLADPVSKTYIMVGPAGRSVMSYKSKDLIHWTGPDIIYTAADDVWGDIKINSIWAPELHYYKGKYYLFQTFDTSEKFGEQWRNWERNRRAPRPAPGVRAAPPAPPCAAARRSSGPTPPTGPSTPSPRTPRCPWT